MIHRQRDPPMYNEVMNSAYCCGRRAVNLDGTLSQSQGASGLVSNPTSHLPEAGLVIHVAIVLSYARVRRIDERG